MPKISLIATLLNESSTIEALLQSLILQTRQADEIILVDGGSTDNTLQIIEAYSRKLPIKVLREDGCNISRGRNLAIAAASGEVIVATDAGVRIPPEWIATLTAPFNVPETHIAAGFFHPDPDPHSPFEVAMCATTLPLINEIRPQKFLPSSRSVAFRKSAWEAVGGYPEWLDYCEDLIFDLRLKAHYGDFTFVPTAFVYFKPRTTLRAFFKQYYLYARGDGKADLFRKRHAARYLTYLVLLPLIAMLCLWITPTLILLACIGAAVYLQQPYRRLPKLWENLSLPQKLMAIFYIPIIRGVGDLAKMIGYPLGWAWRWRHWQNL